MEHTFIYDLCEFLVIITLMVDVFMLKRRVKRLEQAQKSQKKGDDLWERYKSTAPRQ